MQLIRLAIANINTTVGAVQTNTDRVVARAHEAERDQATLVAFPEQSLGGYAPEDLVHWPRFVEAQRESLHRLAGETQSLSVAIAVGVVVAKSPHLYNAAALIYRGKVLGIVPKEKLPAYNVFYETRTFTPGRAGLNDEIDTIPFGDLLFRFDFGTVALEVCEDIWSPEGPLRRRAYAGAEVVINCSASPFRIGVVPARREHLTVRSSDHQLTILYANLVGANDGLIFDGGGFIAQNGRVLHEGMRFREGVTAATVDLDRTRQLRVESMTFRNDQAAFNFGECRPRTIVADSRPAPRRSLTYSIPATKSFFLPPDTVGRSKRTEFCEDILDALALGVGDYFEKSGAFRSIGIALSGGRDSLLCLIVARRYLGIRFAAIEGEARRTKIREMLHTFFLPSKYSSAETRLAAETAADEYDATLVTSPIDDAVEAALSAHRAMLQPGQSPHPLVAQNVQARVRAERMWTWSNSAAGLFLQTSNMSEKAVGYTTIGGDMEGSLSVIANVPKTVVNYLLDYLLEQTGSSAIKLTLLKPASAELAPNQEDERDLMPFAVLDACFALYAGEKMSPAEVAGVIESMFPEYDAPRLREWADKFVRLFTTSIYKWVQTPLSLHIGNLDLERERAMQLPVVQKLEWAGPGRRTPTEP